MFFFTDVRTHTIPTHHTRTSIRYSPKEDAVDRDIRRETERRERLVKKSSSKSKRSKREKDHDDDDTKVKKKHSKKKNKVQKKKKKTKRQESKEDYSDEEEEEVPSKEISFHECLVRARNADKNFEAVKEFATTPVRTIECRSHVSVYGVA